MLDQVAGRFTGLLRGYVVILTLFAIETLVAAAKGVQKKIGSLVKSRH